MKFATFIVGFLIGLTMGASAVFFLRKKMEEVKVKMAELENEHERIIKEHQEITGIWKNRN